MKKYAIAGLVGAILLLVIVYFGFIRKSNKKDETNIPIEEKVKDGTSKKQGDFIVEDVHIQENGAENVVTGDVTNSGATTKSITIVLMMTDSKTGRLYGIQNIDVNDLKPKERRNFSLSIIGDYSNVDTFEVRINEK